VDVLNEDPGNIETVLNVDRTLWMHAFNYVLINFDSYIGYAQNYYIYEDINGRFNPEVGQALHTMRQEDTSEADQVMAYVEILKDQNLRSKMLKVSQVMTNFASRKGPYKDEDFVEFSGRIIQSLIDMQKQRASQRPDTLCRWVYRC